MNLCRIATVIMVAAALLVTTVAAQETVGRNSTANPSGGESAHSGGAG